MIVIHCDACGALVHAAEEQTGRMIECLSCGYALRVPGKRKYFKKGTAPRGSLEKTDWSPLVNDMRAAADEPEPAPDHDATFAAAMERREHAFLATRAEVIDADDPDLVAALREPTGVRRLRLLARGAILLAVVALAGLGYALMENEAFVTWVVETPPRQSALTLEQLLEAPRRAGDEATTKGAAAALAPDAPPRASAWDRPWRPSLEQLMQKTRPATRDASPPGAPPSGSLPATDATGAASSPSRATSTLAESSASNPPPPQAAPVYRPWKPTWEELAQSAAVARAAGPAPSRIESVADPAAEPSKPWRPSLVDHADKSKIKSPKTEASSKPAGTVADRAP